MTNQSKEPVWIETGNQPKEPVWIEKGNHLLDSFIKNGIPSGDVSVIIGKSRSIGSTYNHRKLWLEWRKTYRLMKLKRYFNTINN